MYIYVYVSIVIYATKVSFSHAQVKYIINGCFNIQVLHMRVH